MKQKIVLLLISLICTFSYTYSYTPTVKDKEKLEKVYKGLDAIYKASPSKIETLSNKLTSAKSKFKKNPRILYIIISLEDHISTLTIKPIVREEDKHVDLLIKTLQKYYSQGSYQELMKRDNDYFAKVSKDLFDDNSYLLDKRTNYMFTKEFLSNIFFIQNHVERQLDIYKNYKPLTSRQKQRYQNDFSTKWRLPKSDILFELPEWFRVTVSWDKLIFNWAPKTKIPRIQLNGEKVSFFLWYVMYDTHISWDKLTFDFFTPIMDWVDDNERMKILSFKEDNILRILKVYQILEHNFMQESSTVSELLTWISWNNMDLQNDLLMKIYWVSPTNRTIDYEEPQTFFHLLLFKYKPTITDTSIVYWKNQLPFLKEWLIITKKWNTFQFTSPVSISDEEFKIRISLMYDTLKELNK